MDFFMTMADERGGQDSTLRKIGALIDRQCLAALFSPVRSHMGRAL